MKRTVAFIAGVVSLGVLAYVGSRLGAQPAAGNPAPQTKIALVNVGQVIKNYAKWKVYQDEFKAKVEGLEKQYKELKDKQDQYAKAIPNPAISAADRESYEKAVKTLRNQMQDLSEDSKAQLGKMQADQYTLLYRDVQTVVADLARSRQLDLVLQYNDVAGDPTTNPLSIQRRLTSDGGLPMYAAPGMDITGDVTTTLNNWYTKSMPGTTGAAAPGAGAH